MMFISVDFPLPEGPRTATNSPGWMSRLTPRSARTSTSPIWKTLVTSWMEISGGAMRLERPPLGRPSGTWGGGGCRPGRDLHPGEHLVAGLQRPASDLGERAVGDADGDLKWFGVVSPQHPHR